MRSGAAAVYDLTFFAQGYKLLPKGGGVTRLTQTQSQRLSQQQLQNVKLLQMSSLELREYVQELAVSNPLIEPEDLPPAPMPAGNDAAVDKLRWLAETDRQNNYFQSADLEERDPFLSAGTDGGLAETLPRFVARQLDGAGMSESESSLVLFLCECLDRDGYLRVSPEELAADTGLPAEELRSALSKLQTLEPAGIGAAGLAECLALQLRRAGIAGTALEIVEHHMEALARHHYHAIASRLGVTEKEVLAAAETIRQLDPRPGAIFAAGETVAYILPDLYVEEVDGRLAVRLSGGERPPFHISQFYLDLLKTTSDREVKDYLTSRLRQAENVLWAVNLRGSTLLRCGQIIARRQAGFFREGPRELLLLRMSDVARELGVHESTVSRAVRGKYLQCSRGLFPLSHFFSASAVKSGVTDLGGNAARAILTELIENEDRAHPLSDQKLCQLLAFRGCPVSRRTVAKYRGEMNIPPASARKRSGGRANPNNDSG